MRRGIGICLNAMLWIVVVTCGLPAKGGIIDAINGNAVVAGDYNTSFYFAGPYEEGWNYTPTQSYTLTGISTVFSASNDNGNPAVSPTITAQIESSVGGTVLSQGPLSPVVSSANGGTVGTTSAFSPVSLITNTTYFIDFQNITGMGTNFGQWQGSPPEPSAGATTDLGYVFFGTSSAGPFSELTGSSLYKSVTSSYGSYNAAAGEPILFFSGVLPVPEPSSIVLIGIGAIGLWIVVRRRIKRGGLDIVSQA